MECNRQEVFLGKESLDKIQDTVIAIVGLGSLGSRHADALARLGIKKLILIDNDTVKQENMSTQLYSKDDLGKTKAEATADNVKRINPDAETTVINERLTAENKSILDADLIIDGTDNYDTRYVINDYCVDNDIPWVMGACLRSQGMTASFIPDRPCLRCVMPVEPTTEENACNQGVLGETASVCSSLQIAQMISIISGKSNNSMITFDILEPKFDIVKMQRRQECYCTGKW